MIADDCWRRVEQLYEAVVDRTRRDAVVAGGRNLHRAGVGTAGGTCSEATA